MDHLTVSRRRFSRCAAAGVLAAVSLPRVGFARQTPTVPADAQQAVVTDHPDGEKFKVEIDGDEQEVRMIGIDAPEIKNDDDLPECFAAESREYLQQLVPTGSTVLLERDEEDKDGKDRLWRYVWFHHPSLGEQHILVNERVVRDGRAIDREEEKNTKYEQLIAEAQAAAQAAGAGLWGTCGGGHVAITPVPRHGSEGDPGVVGEAIEVAGLSATLLSAFYTFEYNFITPKGGYVFLILEVELRNVGDEKLTYSDSNFAAKDLDTGADFDDTFTFLDSYLGDGELSPGEYVYGQVALEVQETSTNIRVKYTVSRELFEDDPVLYWMVPR
jgi:micrococcal nuclease